MASLGEVYGSNFQEQSVHDKAVYAAKLFASNIIHKQFSFRNESYDMWQGNNMKQDIIDTLIQQVKTNSPKFRLLHVNKTSTNINAFPYLINDPVEYFVVVDFSVDGKTQIYSLYITPTMMEAY